MKKRYLASFLSLAMALTLTACGNAGASASSAPASNTSASSTSTSVSTSDPYANLAPVVLRGADSSGKGAAGQQLGELVATKLDMITNGKLTVEYYPNIVLQTAPTVSFVPAVAVFDLPMVFAKYDGDTIDKVLNQSEFHDAIAKQYASSGMRIMGYLQNATYRLTTSKIKLDTLDAFKGLRIRTMENKNHMAFWTALGAAPTPLAWPEVYLSLQNGMKTLPTPVRPPICRKFRSI